MVNGISREGGNPRRGRLRQVPLYSLGTGINGPKSCIRHFLYCPIVCTWCCTLDWDPITMFTAWHHLLAVSILIFGQRFWGWPKVMHQRCIVPYLPHGAAHLVLVHQCKLTSCYHLNYLLQLEAHFGCVIIPLICNSGKILELQSLELFRDISDLDFAELGMFLTHIQ